MKQSTITRRQVILSLSFLSLFVLGFGGITIGITQLQNCPTQSAASAAIQPDSNPDQLTLLAYNLKLRPRLLFANGQSDRVLQMSSLLRGYDALILSEAFDDYSQQQLLTDLESFYNCGENKQCISDEFGTNRGLSQDSGLRVVSRWPIVFQVQQFFERCRGWSCFNQQGVLLVHINKKGTPYYLLTAQFQGGREKADQAIRSQQIEEVKAFLLSRESEGLPAAERIPADARIIFAGSLPMEIGEPLDLYQEMEKELAIAPLPQIGTFKDSVNPQQNSLAHAGKPRTLDYIFTFKNFAQPQKASVEIRPLRTSPEKSWKSSAVFYWQCPQQDLSDHYAVKGQLDYSRLESSK